MLYTLTSGGVTAVVDSLGAELISLKDASGTERLWGGDPAVWSGRSPHLFPIASLLRDNTHVVDGKAYPLAKHGFARKQEYALVEQTENQIVLSLSENETTLAGYPFPFRFDVTHTYDEKGFSTRYTVTNTGKSDMPFCIGAHPGFVCPVFPGERFEDYVIRLDRPATVRAYHMGGDDPLRKQDEYNLFENSDTLALDYDFFDKGCLIMDKPPFEEVLLVHKDTGRGVRFSFPGFPVLALWTMEHKRGNYLCLEPWHGLPVTETDGPAIKDKPYAVVLHPGTQFSLAYTAQWI